MVGSVTAALAAYVPRGARLTLGLSGGVDSVALLDVLARLAPSQGCALRCLHVHHGLSANADMWERFCGTLAARYRVPIDVERVNIRDHPGLGTEGAARAARYRAFARSAADFIVLAHHRDDQAETLLLNLVRGAGPRGLGGMQALRRMPAGPSLLRPLLGVARRDLEAYARAGNLAWIEDESNGDTHLARNLVRHEVMPLLARLNPAAAANVARSARHLREAQEILASVAAADLQGCVRNERLDLRALESLGHARAKNALRVFCERSALPLLDSTALEEMLEQLLRARADAALRFVLGNHLLHRYRGELWILPRGTAGLPFTARWQGQNPWVIPQLGGAFTFAWRQGEGINAEWLERGPVEVRLRAGGERLRPDPARPRRTLKNLLQERGVPPWERTRLPLVYCAGRLVFVPGIGVESECAAAPGRRGAALNWVPAGGDLAKGRVKISS